MGSCKISVNVWEAFLPFCGISVILWQAFGRLQNWCVAVAGVWTFAKLVCSCGRHLDVCKASVWLWEAFGLM